MAEENSSSFITRKLFNSASSRICLFSGESVIMVSSWYVEQRKSILTGFLFQIRQHFRIYATFKQNLSVLCIDNLTTIIGKDKTSVISKFKRFCQRQQTIGRPAGSQNNTYSHLLNLQQVLKHQYQNEWRQLVHLPFLKRLQLLSYHF